MKERKSNAFPKTPTGIGGLDEITNGGFPKGRPILICGSAGCGKTLFAAQFIVKGITDYNEPGVIMTFEESGADLSQNFKSLGFDLEKLKDEKKLKVDFVRIERSEIEETGEYDMEALFIRLNYAIETIGAKRVVLDTIESIFSGMSNEAILRSEIRRLFRWLKDKGITTVITAERGSGSLTRQGLEEYVSDCVILLDFRVTEQIATRRLRIVKYRGSTHGTNEYPFLIDEKGIYILPVTSLKLAYTASREIISTGLPDLDQQFTYNGIYKGNCVLLTGTAGTAKTILASYFAMGCCKRKEKVLYFSFEESPDQLIRNMGDIGLNFKSQVRNGLLHIHSSRPTLQGLEMHLLILLRLITEIQPKAVIVDPISSLITIGSSSEVRGMLVRLMDTLKTNLITAWFNTLIHHPDSRHFDETVTTISSLADTWIHVTNEIEDGQRKRALTIVKSRGMGHEINSVNFNVTEKGIHLRTK